MNVDLLTELWQHAGGLTLHPFYVLAGTRASGIEFEHAVFAARLLRAWGRPHLVQFSNIRFPGSKDPKGREVSGPQEKKRIKAGTNVLRRGNDIRGLTHL